MICRSLTRLNLVTCIYLFLSNSSVFLVSTFAIFGLPHMSEDYKYYVIPYAAPYILPILQTFLTISVYATVAIGQNIVLFSISYVFSQIVSHETK